MSGIASGSRTFPRSWLQHGHRHEDDDDDDDEDEDDEEEDDDDENDVIWFEISCTPFYHDDNCVTLSSSWGRWKEDFDEN